MCGRFTLRNKEEVQEEYGIELIDEKTLTTEHYEGVVLAVAHKQFSLELIERLEGSPLTYDVKSCLPKEKVTARL